MSIFHPFIGDRDLRFDRLWQVVQYELGFSAHKTGLPIPPHASAEYRKGHADAAAEHNRAKQVVVKGS